jgi:hypothetical protein
VIDRVARDKMAEALRHFASGMVSMGEYSALLPGKSNDSGLRRTILLAWDVFEDFLMTLDHDLYMRFDEVDGRLRGDYHLPAKMQKDIARLILFLQSDHNCLNDLESTPLTCGQAVLFAPLILAGLLLGVVVLCVLILTFGFWPFFVLPMLIAIVFAFHEKNAEVSSRFWPFASCEDYEEALKHPKLLCGKRAA